MATITNIVQRGGGYTITMSDGRTVEAEVVYDVSSGQLVLSSGVPTDVLTALTNVTLGTGLAALSGGTPQSFTDYTG